MNQLAPAVAEQDCFPRESSRSKPGTAMISSWRLRSREFSDRALRIDAGTRDLKLRRTELESLCRQWDIAPPAKRLSDKSAVARMRDPRWAAVRFWSLWERDLEARAIALGWVHRFASPYVSEATLSRYRTRQRWTAETLKETTARNEVGDELTLAALVGSGTGNKKNQWAEIWTRLLGFESYARDAMHTALFITITVPGAMHARRHRNGKANPHYAGTTPREVHEYLQKNWARIRAKLSRKAVDYYGIRVAEPHHDGCPHWHLLLYTDPRSAMTLRKVIEQYVLKDVPELPSEEQKLLTCETIDLSEKSTIGYILKGISRQDVNDEAEIGGKSLSMRDLAERVNAWSSIHGVRQFSFIGGPPAELWHEIRRLSAASVRNAPPVLQKAWHAAQGPKFKLAEMMPTAAESGDMLPDERNAGGHADYGRFLQAIGGPMQRRRDYPLQVAKCWDEREGRYGVEGRMKAFGVAHVSDMAKVYEAPRHTWTINSPKGSTALSEGRVVLGKSVNNCTVDGQEGQEYVVQRLDLRRARPPVDDSSLMSAESRSPAADFSPEWLTYWGAGYGRSEISGDGATREDGPPVPLPTHGLGRRGTTAGAPRASSRVRSPAEPMRRQATDQAIARKGTEQHSGNDVYRVLRKARKPDSVHPLAAPFSRSNRVRSVLGTTAASAR